MATILIVDDEETIRQSLSGILQDEGFSTLIAENGEQGFKTCQEEVPDLILLDIWMPGIDGLETLTKIKQHNADQLVVMMSGHGTIETAVKSTKLGAFDFIEKPLSLEKVLLTIQNALKVHTLQQENKRLRARYAQEHQMIGESEPLQTLSEQISMVAPASASVLITGENGTGKELVARSIHAQSKRADQAFVEVNCAAIPEDLIESELFGHEKGAFTGATQARKGKFDQANGGTLLLDEIGDMSLKTQAKILRILQERKFERVGGHKTIEVDVRIIAATNKDLEHEIREGNFREDLYFRLNVVPFHVPPLRERKADIKLMAQHFMTFFCNQEGKATKEFSKDALEQLSRYPWPGNVRELKNLMERLVIMTPGETIEARHLPSSIIESSGLAQGMDTGNQALAIGNLKDARDSFERDYIITHLKANDWNISRTAEAIGLERSNLHRKIKSYDIDLKAEEKG